MHNRSPTHHPPRPEAGVTLVEVMVASIILGLTVSAIAYMIINSTVLRLANDHNRQARIYAQEELEDPDRHFFNYDGIGNDNSDLQFDVGDIDIKASSAHIKISTVARTATIKNITIPYKEVRSKITWTENDRADSLTLGKVVTKVR